MIHCKTIIMETELMITNAPSGMNIFQYIEYVWFTGIVILFGMFASKIILRFLDYLRKQIKQIELNSALINTLIDNNDHKNLNFEETVQSLTQQIIQNNTGIYNDVANIERQFYNETEIYNNHKPMPADTLNLLWSKTFLFKIIICEIFK